MHMEDLTGFLQRMVWLIGFELNRSGDIVGRNIQKKKKNAELTKKYGSPVVFKCWHLANGNFEPNSS